MLFNSYVRKQRFFHSSLRLFTQKKYMCNTSYFVKESFQYRIKRNQNA